MKNKAYIICEEHGKQEVMIEVENHTETRNCITLKSNSIKRYTAKCPICGVRCICL